MEYVYTLDACRHRLRRGARAVLLFWPSTGRLVEVTRSNLSEIRRLWKEQAQ